MHVPELGEFGVFELGLVKLVNETVILLGRAVRARCYDQLMVMG